jgi:hypothetical protein
MAEVTTLHDPEDWLDDHYIRLGTRTPRCVVDGCDETDPRALTGTDPFIVCYEHERLAAGRSWTEADHRAGRYNWADTVDVPGNDHRVLSDMQQAWPHDTLRNQDGSPLLQAAACVRGWLDVLRLIIQRTVGWVPTFLEALDAWLRTRLGDPWWKDFPWVAGDAT